MVKGLDKFREALGAYNECFVIIGGTACDAILSETTVRPRATEDIDMLLVVDKITENFGKAFWQFIKDGKYRPERHHRVSDEKPRYELYRFVDPLPGYPVKIELLSKNVGIFTAPSDMRIEPFPLGEDLSSLSAIIMDDTYYQVAVELSEIRENLRFASLQALLILKIKAYQNLMQERRDGRQVNTKDIKKHRNDVFKLLASGTPAEPVVIKPEIMDSILGFTKEIRDSLPNQSLSASLGNRSDNYIQGLLMDLEDNFIVE